MPKEGGAGSQNQDGKGGGSGDSIQIKVGEEVKTFTPQEIATHLEKAGNLEKTLEGMSGFQKVLTQYGINADEYLRNSEAAFAIANSLIERGIIDEQGNVIEKKATGKDGGGTDDSQRFKFTDQSGQSKQLDTIGKALQSIVSKVEQLEEGQSNIYRRNIKRDVQAKHPELDDRDISQLLATAQRDKSKGFWEHAAAIAGDKSTMTKQVEKTYVKSVVETLAKAGIIPEGKIDMAKLDEMDLNTLREQSPEGGAPTYEGKKFLFGSRMKRLKAAGEDVSKFVSPAEATHETFSHKI